MRLFTQCASALVCLSLATSASAATYYVADCQTGADPACVPGSDGNAGTSPNAPWRTTTRVGSVLATLAAGDQVLFARGGSWVNASMNATNLHATPAMPIVFDAYTPSWGPGTARPILTESRTGTNLFNFNDQGSQVLDGGYTIKNLDLRGGGTGNWGIFLYNGVQHVTIDDVSVSGFVIGIHINGNVPISDVSITNSTIANNAQHGILGAATNLLIQGNVVVGNGFDVPTFGSGFTHGIYLGGDGAHAVVRGNTFTDNTVYDGQCVAGPLVVHGQWDDVLIESNVMTQIASAPGCYGISVKPDYATPEHMTHFVIRANTVVNMGNVGIALTSVPGILVEDNVIVNTQATAQTGIALPVKKRDADDIADDAAVLRNNSIYFAQAAAGSIGIQSNAEGANHQVVSNLIQFGSPANASHDCFLAGSVGSYAVFSNNLCFHASGKGAWSSAYATLAAAQAAGFDANGLAVDPLLLMPPTTANGWSMALQAGSPARNAGSVTSSSPVDRNLAARDGAPDIGAYEYGAAPAQPDGGAAADGGWDAGGGVPEGGAEGADAAVAGDAARADGGGSGAANEGCACDAARSRPAAATVGTWLVVGAIVRRRWRRRASGRSMHTSEPPR